MIDTDHSWIAGKTPHSDQSGIQADDAKRRLADEYDAAQERGEVRSSSNQHTGASSPEVAGVADIGLTHKEIHEARLIRDAEASDPGIVRHVLDEALAAGEEPTESGEVVGTAKQSPS